MLPFYQSAESHLWSLPLPLCSYDELPPFLQHNPFVRSGYRSMFTARMCVQSILRWHNETVNIWSHLLGCVLACYWLVSIIGSLREAHAQPASSAQLWQPPPTGVPLIELMLITVSYVAQVFCFICSAGYHIFNCQNKQLYERWLALDISGICIGCLGCYLLGLYYGFYCHWFWRDVYAALVASGFALVLLLVHFDASLLRAERHCRLVVMVTFLVGIGIVPALHWAFLNGLDSPIVNQFLPRIIGFYAIFLLAFSFYIAKFPESLWPGRFDYVGCSHQIWHLLIVVGFYWWFFSCRDLIVFLVDNPCTTV